MASDTGTPPLTMLAQLNDECLWEIQLCLDLSTLLLTSKLVQKDEAEIVSPLVVFSVDLLEAIGGLGVVLAVPVESVCRLVDSCVALVAAVGADQHRYIASRSSSDSCCSKFSWRRAVREGAWILLHRPPDETLVEVVI